VIIREGLPEGKESIGGGPRQLVHAYQGESLIFSTASPIENQ